MTSSLPRRYPTRIPDKIAIRENAQLPARYLIIFMILLHTLPWIITLSLMFLLADPTCYVLVPVITVMIFIMRYSRHGPRLLYFLLMLNSKYIKRN